MKAGMYKWYKITGEVPFKYSLTYFSVIPQNITWHVLPLLWEALISVSS